MGKLSTWTLLAVFSLLVVKGICEDLDLSDALDDKPPTSAPKVEPAGGDVKPTTKRPVQPTVPVKNPVKPKPKQTEETYTDFFDSTIRPGLLPRTTTKPLQTSVHPRKQSGSDDFDLSDALNPDNDIRGKGKDSDKNAGGFSNDDLADIGNDNTYKPDKGKGKGGQGTSGNDLEPADENNYDTMAETGTIAGIISAVGMALVGAVSGYISYQKKKLCFSIQQSLNTDMVKADAPDAVVAQEPQVQQTLLQPPNAEPPTEENAV
ncbi:CD99 antigen-like protein 2 isoform X2 [Triplophysa rosa]|uniref:CD99 antigen-like protein 2 n=1 Tax=Triplophysa rosa TaxID=992332 RepID=A0A9W7X5T2_TRIRA|nr:CD99 antigen-like protein 2 isoform X2 [Triplophysa rosa]KAI7814538.1 putative CD99 antigen-like protein 2 [Triplophysa rosa]